jgi:hypothetical protein
LYSSTAITACIARATACIAFDPRILYDAETLRWFAVAVDVADAPNHFLVAVSNGADPTQGWAGFQIDSDSTDQFWADFPTLGINGEGVFIGAMLFRHFASSSERAAVLVLPKDDLVSPVPSVANATLFENLHASQVGLIPQAVVDLERSGSPAIFMDAVMFPRFGLMTRADVAGSVTAPLLQPMTQIFPPQSHPLATSAEQPGPKMNIDVGDGDFQSSVLLVNGSVWGVSNVDVNGRSALHWIEIDAATNAVRQQGLIADDELEFYYGSIAVNDFGRVVIGCSGSSESQFVSSYAAVGETIDGVTVFDEPILLKAGVSDYQMAAGARNRWGDYSATVVDPADPYVFWTFQEFVAAQDVWGVQITELRPSSCDDGRDNDGDGLADWPSDPGCAAVADTSELDPALICDNGLDDDGDGLTDAGQDPGCSGCEDPDGSERDTTGQYPCDDGVDNDGDGRIDFDPATKADAANGYTAGSGDPGCGSAQGFREDPQCQDGTDNDSLLNDPGDGTDFDGGVGAADPPNPPDPHGADPQCNVPWRDCEHCRRCGLGFELTLLVVPLLCLRRRRA